jgi:hypothetical protein
MRFPATAALYSLADAAGVRVNADDGNQDFVSGPPAPAPSALYQWNSLEPRDTRTPRPPWNPRGIHWSPMVPVSRR